MIPFAEDQTLTGLLRELFRESKALLRQEVDLVKVEMSKKVSRAGKDLLFIGIGVALACGGLLVLLASAVLIVAHILPPWIASLAVGLVVVAIGYGFIQKGITDLKNVSPVPHHAINALKEDKQWEAQQAS